MQTSNDLNTAPRSGDSTVVVPLDEAVLRSAQPTDRLVRRRATDVLVEAAEDGANSVSPAAPRGRRLGDVYPVMKNTIYSDEECMEEVTVSTLDCGVRFIRYVSGLFQYLVRNPKTMGLIFTTIIILLFFKYSQQVVVRAVRAAVNTHPSLEPSDELLSAVQALETEMLSFEGAVRALQKAYASVTYGESDSKPSVVSYDMASLTGSAFLSLAAGTQASFSNIVQTYAIYKIPAANDGEAEHWGKAGCQSAGDRLGGEPLCMMTDSKNTVVSFKGTNTSHIIDTIPDITMEDPMHMFQNRQVGWTQSRQFDDLFYNESSRVITFVLPAFCYYSVKGCVAYVAVDISVAAMAKSVHVPIPNMEVIVADRDYFSREGGQFLLDTMDHTLYWDSPQLASSTPAQRINDIVKPILRERTKIDFNGAFFENGLIYQSVLMMHRWDVMASSPLVLSAAEIESSFRALLDSYEHMTGTASYAYGGCERSANAQEDNTFLEIVGQMEGELRGRLHSFYVAYELTGTEGEVEAHSSSSSSSSSADLPSSPGLSASADSSSSLDSEKEHGTESSASKSGEDSDSSSNDNISSDDEGTTRNSPLSASSRQWGACGCTRSWRNMCFYTNSSGIDTMFEGYTRSTSSTVNHVEFATTHRHDFIHDNILPAGSVKGAGGYWTKPYTTVDKETNRIIMNAMSYVLPFQFDSNGLVTAAAVFDLTMDWLPDFLRYSTHTGTTGLLLLDRRGDGTFMASRSYKGDRVYPAMTTTNETVNRIMSLVHSRAGSFDKAISFHDGGMLVNYELIEPHWGVVELIPADEALSRYLPTPAVTGATDALRLIPTGETIVLFLYVAGILAVYFLNLLVLGCSTLGVKR